MSELNVARVTGITTFTTSSNVSFGNVTATSVNATTFTGNGAGLSGIQPFPAGTAMLFIQTAAPTGWTKSTTHNNKALRIVSGAASSGGTVAFTTAFAAQSVAGTVGGTTLTTTQIPSHTHTQGFVATLQAASTCGGSPAATATPSNTGATGGGGSHTHSFTGTAIDLAVQYVDAIIATKD